MTCFKIDLGDGAMKTPEATLAPDIDSIRCHLETWAAPYIGTEYEDGLCEIAFTAPGSSAPDRARFFGLDDLDAAARFAMQENAQGANIYIGAALRTPEANPHKRGSTLDFYAAAFAVCEADKDADDVAERIEAAGFKGAIRVMTGQHPEKRVHHWLPLRELCDDPDAYTEALVALVAHVGADAKVKDSARVLRLGGTVNWITNPTKQAKGYVDELTALRAEVAPKADLGHLIRLDPMPGWQPSHKGGRGGNGGLGEIICNDAGFVIDGRETFWRQIVFAELGRYQRQTGADPTADEIFDAAFREFCKKTEGDDRWTSEQGQRELRKRVQNTLRRLRLGYLAKKGLYSIETEEGREHAEKAQEAWKRKRDEQVKGGAATSDGRPRPNAPTQPDLSQDALANDLGKRTFDLDAKFVATWGKWLFWTGTRWQIDDRLDHLTRIRDFTRKRAEELTTWADCEADKLAEKEGKKLRDWAKAEARTVRSKATVVSIESLARSNLASVASTDAFDEERLLLGTPGGTVDLKTGHLRPAERSDMITKQTACAPASPGSHPERWLNFLSEIFDGDADLVSFMQRAAGYALTGLTTEHKLLFLYGTGRNGKSVFLNTLTHIWADYARRSAAETFLNSASEKHSTGLAGLQGARLVAGSELPVGKTWDESVVKDLTGGDRMTARFMRCDFFDFDPQLTLMIAGNNQPSFRGVDEAIRARVVLVPFTVTIPPERRDKSLTDKLMAEGPQILRWAIEGAQQWLDQGLNVPESVAAASTEYMDGEDTLGQFLADATTTDPAGFITTSDLHQKFTSWCEMQGLHPWTLRTLQKDMKSRGWQDARRNHGRGFQGLKLA